MDFLSLVLNCSVGSVLLSESQWRVDGGGWRDGGHGGHLYGEAVTDLWK